MPNPIKYSTGSESDALKKGNFHIGTGDVGKGPSDVTGYYQAVSPPSGGYVIYLNNPSSTSDMSYHVANNDSELISFTNNLAGQSYTTTQECFDYYYGQTDKVLVNQDYPTDYPYIVMDGLILNLDAGITQSYSGSGTVWTDVNGFGPKNNGTLTNGPTFDSGNGGSVVFDGSDDFVNLGNIFNNVFAGLSPKFTISAWVKLNSVTDNTSIMILAKHGDSNFGENERQFLFRILNYTPLNYGGNQLEFGNYPSLTTSSYRFVRTTLNPPGLTTGVFYHFTVTFDGTINTNDGLDRVNLYIQGQPQNKTLSFVNGSLPSNFSTGDARLAIGATIGKKVSNSPRALLNGNVSAIQIYNRALSATEVLQNYNAQKGRFGL